MSAEISQSQFSDIVGAIYDSAVEPGRWPQTLSQICAAIGSPSSAIFMLDLVSYNFKIPQIWGEAPEYTRVLFGPLRDDNLRLFQTLTALHISTDGPMVISRILPRQEFLASRMYQEWCRPQGYIDGIFSNVIAHGRKVGFVGVTRHERDGVATDVEVSFMRLLASHLRRAITISDLLDMRTLEAGALKSTLDGVTLGVVIVADDSHILHANDAARAMFKVGAPVQAMNGFLVAEARGASEELSRAIAIARRTETSLGATGFNVPLIRNDGPPAMAHVLPLSHGDIRTRLIPRAAAAVFITLSETVPSSDIAGVAAAYNLTRAESRLLTELAKGHTLTEALVGLGIGEPTAKTQLRSIFAKTGVSRQAELIDLIRRLQPPVRGQS
jgi:DNA-binding CsgD family transcriptional regulator